LNALVFVHGLSGSGRWWRPVLPFFRDRDVRIVDLPRFGAVQGFGPHDAAAWLGDWLDDEGLAGADVAGHSLGGLIAAGVAALALPASLLLRRPIPEGRRMLAAEAGLELRQPPLSRSARVAVGALLALSLAFFAWTVGKALGAYFEPGGMSNRALLIVGPDKTVQWSYVADSPGDLPGVNLLFDNL